MWGGSDVEVEGEVEVEVEGVRAGGRWLVLSWIGVSVLSERIEGRVCVSHCVGRNGGGRSMLWRTTSVWPCVWVVVAE